GRLDPRRFRPAGRDPLTPATRRRSALVLRGGVAVPAAGHTHPAPCRRLVAPGTGIPPGTGGNTGDRPASGRSPVPGRPVSVRARRLLGVARPDGGILADVDA